MNPWTALVVVTAIICVTVVIYGYMTEYINYKKNDDIRFYERRADLYKEAFETSLKMIKQCFCKISNEQMSELNNFYNNTYMKDKR